MMPKNDNHLLVPGHSSIVRRRRLWRILAGVTLIAACVLNVCLSGNRLLDVHRANRQPFDPPQALTVETTFVSQGERQVTQTLASTPSSWAAEDALFLPQYHWRNWLSKRFLQESTHLKKATLYTGCGLSMRMNFSSSNWLSAYFKLAISEDRTMLTIGAESHLREIKAAYLDKILGTGVVAPCVGGRFNYETVKESIVGGAVQQQIFDNNTLCRPDSGELTGAVSLFMRGAEEGSKKDVFSAAFAYRENIQQFNGTRFTSAISYAVFNYLAGCIKSDHNHFRVNKTRFVAIDNDRCFTPEHLINLPGISNYNFNLFHLWEVLVFATCHFPSKIVAALEEATSDNNTTVLSEKLVVALSEDALAEELLSSQPEAFSDIDNRATRLVQHIRACNQGGLASSPHAIVNQQIYKSPNATRVSRVKYEKSGIAGPTHVSRVEGTSKRREFVQPSNNGTSAAPEWHNISS